MQAREIGAYLSKKEPPDAIRIPPPYLCNGCSMGRIMSHKVVGIKGHYYVLPKWLDENEKLRDGFAEKLDMLE